MKYSFNYGNDVITLPKSAAAHLAHASRESMALLISLASDKSISSKKRAAALGISVQELEDAVLYWSALGVISLQDTDAVRAGETVSPQNNDIAEKTSGARNGGSTESGRRSANTSGSKKAPSRRADTGIPLENSTPHLTIPELADHARTEKTSWLLEYCQQKMGRMLNSAEAERIVGICDYLGVSCDFVALLCDNLKKENRLTPRALENLAIELHDRGITDYDALIEFTDHRERAHSFEGKIRKLFGLGSRALTPAEKKMLERWATVGTSAEMIDFAYELTVSTTGNASLKYANAIIEAWAADGVKSAEEAKKREENFRQRTSKKPAERKKKTSEQTISSFDTDDYFEKALRRSFGNDFYDNVWNGDEGPSDGGPSVGAAQAGEGRTRAGTHSASDEAPLSDGKKR